MKILISIAFGLTCYGQSLVVSSADTRCTPNTGQVTGCNYTGVLGAPTNLPVDYGVKLTTSGSGTWTISNAATSCSAQPIFQMVNTSNAAITSFTAGATIYLYPNEYIVYGCSQTVQNYTETVVFTNGATTVSVSAVMLFSRKAAIGPFLNGFGIADSALGCTKVQVNNAFWPAATYPYYNSCPNPSINPTGGVPIATPANCNVSTDDFGNSLKFIGTGFGVHNSQPSAFNSDATRLLLIQPTGGLDVVTIATCVKDWPLINVALQNGTKWSSTNPNVLYHYQDTFTAGTNNPFRKTTLTTPGSITTIDLWTPPTPCRVQTNGMSRADPTINNKIAYICVYDYTSNWTSSGAVITRTSGTNFDSHLLDQVFDGSTVLSVTNASTLTLRAPAINASGTYNLNGGVIGKICVADLVAMEVAGAGYTPICGDFDTVTPIRPWFNSGSAFMAEDTNDGYTYVYYGTYPDVVGRFRTGIDTTITLMTGPSNPGYHLGPVCNPTPGVIDSNCAQASHTYIFRDSDGVVWTFADGSLNKPFRMRDLWTFPYKTWEAGGGIANWIYLDTDEPGATRNAPYFTMSTNADIDLAWVIANAVNSGADILVTLAQPFGLANGQTVTIGGMNGYCPNGDFTVSSQTSTTFKIVGQQCALAYPANYTYLILNGGLNTWKITNAVTSGANITVTTNSGFPFANGASVLIGAVAGCVELNGAQTISNVSSTGFTVVSKTCTAPYSGTNGAVTFNKPPLLNGLRQDDILIARDQWGEVRRVGHTRSFLFSGGNLEFFNCFPKASASQNGKYIAWSACIQPDTMGVFVATLADVDGGPITPAQFDTTHTVTTAPTATTAVFTLPIPVAAGTAVVEIALNRGFVSSDTGYQTATKTSCTSCTHTFTGLTTSTTYYWRVVAGSAAAPYRWTASGSFTPSGGSTGTGSRAVGVRLNGARIN